jgi:hypothetical protein
MILHFRHILLDLQINFQWRACPAGYPLMTLCNDLAHCFSPMLGQSHQWRDFRDQTLDRLHDGLESNDVEVQIEFPDNFVAGCPCIVHFRSPDGWISAVTVAERCPTVSHHTDMESFDSRILVDATPILG